MSMLRGKAIHKQLQEGTYRKKKKGIISHFQGKDVILGPVRVYLVGDTQYWGFAAIVHDGEVGIDMIYLGEVAYEIDPELEEIADSVILLMGVNELTRSMAESLYEEMVMGITGKAKTFRRGDTELATAQLAHKRWPVPKLRDLIKTIKKEQKK